MVHLDLGGQGDSMKREEDRVPLLFHFAEPIPRVQESAGDGLSKSTSGGTTGGDSTCEDANIDTD